MGMFDKVSEMKDKAEGLADTAKDMASKVPGGDAIAEKIDGVTDKLPGADALDGVKDKLPGGDALDGVADKIPGGEGIADAVGGLTDKLPGGGE